MLFGLAAVGVGLSALPVVAVRVVLALLVLPVPVGRRLVRVGLVRLLLVLVRSAVLLPVAVLLSAVLLPAVVLGAALVLLVVVRGGVPGVRVRLRVPFAVLLLGHRRVLRRLLLGLLCAE